eukprot:GFUD01131243.1.p1 GENE.GFUD01131243.1~~GFUD01131243.1.p1  ORF type:complete len:486 (+),score=130.82 GFUD01131243.1:45-1502(+)
MDCAEEFPSQSRRSLRRKCRVLYVEDMIDGDTSSEEDEVSFHSCHGENNSVEIDTPGQRESVEQIPKQTSKPDHCKHGREVISPELITACLKNDNATPRRSARCPTPSKKVILNRESYCDQQYESLHTVMNSVKSRKGVHVRVPTDDDKTRLRDKTQDSLGIGMQDKFVCGRRRSPRFSKPTKEILAFRNSIDMPSRLSYRKKRKLAGSSKARKARKVLGQSVQPLVDENSNLNLSTISISDDDFNTGIASSESPPHASPTPHASPPPHASPSNLSCELEKFGYSNTGIATNTSFRTVNHTNSTESITESQPPVESPGITSNTPELPPPIGSALNSEGITPVQVRSSEELLDRKRNGHEEDASSLLPNTYLDGAHTRKNRMVVLTENDDDEYEDHIVPAAPMQLTGDPSNWSCVQCVYQLTRLDERLTITDLKPLLEKKVDGDALLKSSLSDLVNVVGLEYSPAVRVVFQIQQMCKEVALGERDD